MYNPVQFLPLPRCRERFVIFPVVIKYFKHFRRRHFRIVLWLGQNLCKFAVIAVSAFLRLQLAPFYFLKAWRKLLYRLQLVRKYFIGQPEYINIRLFFLCDSRNVERENFARVLPYNFLINIRNNLLYAKDYGIYQDTPKTETSARTVPIPQETAELLQEYRQWWLLLRRESGSAWNMFIEISDSSGNVQKERADFLFIQEGEMLGYPMHPDSITSYLSRFSEREKLPHINPHAFRHTLASVLCLNGIDITTISKWLGHNNVTTTVNIPYGHTQQSSHNSINQNLFHCFL